jgi:hypothetical protein
MSTTKSVHRSLVSLDLPKKVPALISYATSVVTAMTGNTSLLTPAPTLPALTAAITALQTAQSAAIASPRRHHAPRLLRRSHRVGARDEGLRANGSGSRCE